jgi:putative hydrolase of the HAD superfamily
VFTWPRRVFRNEQSVLRIITILDKIKNIKAVLFDIDDTLFDRNGAQRLVLEIIVKRLPGIFHNLVMEQITAAFIESDLITTREFNAGAPSEGLRDIRSRLFLQALGIQEDHADTVTDLYVREYPVVNAPMPGARDIVIELGKKYMTGAVSNGFPDVQYTKLETIGLRKELSCIVLSEELGIRKPDPGIFGHAASLLKVKPGECLYVGDSYTNDVTGAINTGMLACWFNHNQAEPATGDIQPDFIINDLAELTKLLDHN